MSVAGIRRLTFAIAGVAGVGWLCIGIAIWGSWQLQRAAEMEARAGDVAKALDDFEYPAFDRTLSSVQYARLLADEPTPAWLNQRIAAVPPEELSMAGWVDVLREAGAQVCFEEVRRKANQIDRQFTVQPGTVRELLDRCCTTDPRYRWEWMRGSQVINVFPRRTQLEAPVGNLALKRQKLRDCVTLLSPHVQLVWTDVGQPPGPDNILHWPMKVAATEITARDGLNLLVDQYDGMTWSVNYLGYVEFDAPQKTRDAVRKKLEEQAR